MIQPDNVSDRHWAMFLSYIAGGKSVAQLAKDEDMAQGSVMQALARVMGIAIYDEQRRRVQPPTTVEKVKRARTEVACEILMTVRIQHKPIIRALFDFAPWLFGEMSDYPRTNYTTTAMTSAFDPHLCVKCLASE